MADWQCKPGYFLGLWGCHIPVISFSFQILDPELDLRTIKHSIWKSGGDMKLFYREIEQRTEQATKNENEPGSIDN